MAACAHCGNQTFREGRCARCGTRWPGAAASGPGLAEARSPGTSARSPATPLASPLHGTASGSSRPVRVVTGAPSPAPSPPRAPSVAGAGHAARAPSPASVGQDVVPIPLELPPIGEGSPGNPSSEFGGELMRIREVGLKTDAGNVPLIDGFESTRLEGPGAPARKPKEPELHAVPTPEEQAPGFVTSGCPRCGTALTDPKAAFCEACGRAIVRPKKRVDPGAAVRGKKKCRQCCFWNDEQRAACINCGRRV